MVHQNAEFSSPGLVDSPNDGVTKLGGHKTSHDYVKLA